jgi:manganese efflux pump family protein
LAVGLSLGLLGIFVWYPAIIIGVVTGLISLIGLRLGNRLGRRIGKSVEIIGGFVLIGIGLQIVISHLT